MRLSASLLCTFGTALLSARFYTYSAVAAEQQCPQVQIVSPQGSVHERQPNIAWTPAEGVDSYRVELESRVPEGRTLVQLDTKTYGNSFRPPQRLTDFRANVSVKVTPQCAHTRLARPAVHKFQIDTAPLCVLLPDSVKYHVEASDVRWKAVEQADQYQVSVFAGSDGALLLRKETLQPQLRLSPPAPETAVVAVRPHCKTGWGEAVYRVVSSE